MSGRPAKIRADWHVKHHSRFGAWDNLARPRRRKGSFCGKRPQNWLFRSASRRNRCEPGSETRRRTRPTRISTRFAVLFPKTRAHLLTPWGQAARHELNLSASGPRGRQNLQPWVRLFQSRDGDSVFLRHPQCGKDVYRFADDTSDQGRLNCEHRGPGDRHAADAAFGVVVRSTSSHPGLRSW